MAVKHNSIVSARAGNISATIFTDLQNLLENDEALDATLKQVETNAAAIQACMNSGSLSCGGSCKNICSGCSSRCGGNCTGGCSTACDNTCGGGCEGCGGSCSYDCGGGCSDGCSGP